MSEEELKRIQKTLEAYRLELIRRAESIRAALINFNRAAVPIVRKAKADIERGFLKIKLPDKIKKS